MNKKTILETLKRRFEEGGQEEIMLVTLEEGDAPRDALVTLHRGFGLLEGVAQGVFSFSENRGTELFEVRIMLSEDVPAQAVVPLCFRISVINPELVIGAFAYDVQENSLVFTTNFPIAEGLSEEEICNEADTCIALSLSLAGRYAAELQELMTEMEDEA